MKVQNIRKIEFTEEEKAHLVFVACLLCQLEDKCPRLSEYLPELNSEYDLDGFDFAEIGDMLGALAKHC